VFRASGSVAEGTELWRSDGTSIGTVLHQQIARGALDSSPAGFTRIGSRFVFLADDYEHGREPWIMRSMAAAIPFGRGCPGGAARVPKLDAGTAPTLPGPKFALRVSEAWRNTHALFVLDASKGSLPTSPGCTLYVPGLLMIFANPTDGSGVGWLPLPLPADVSLLGARVFSQGLVLDPGNINRPLSFTQGLELILSDG
jgi:ELWxxDGT repeat protein